MVLTEQQIIVLDYSSEGWMDKQIARELGISVETVKWHQTQVRRKLGARNKTHAVAQYVRLRRDHARAAARGGDAT